MRKHVFFDLDKTLTKSRTPMAPAHQDLFERLCAQADVIVVTGGTTEQIRDQITPRFNGKYTTLAQSGNEAIAKNGDVLWNESLDLRQVTESMRFIGLLRQHFNIVVKDGNDLVENRGAQIAYSVLGFHEDIEKKYSFDPDDKKRQAVLKKFPSEVSSLRELGVEVVPAGTTNFSFLPLGKHKGTNVERLRQYMKWNKENCVYVGDALFPGGNDAVVVGVIPTQAVKNPDDTFGFIEKNLLS